MQQHLSISSEHYSLQGSFKPVLQTRRRYVREVTHEYWQTREEKEREEKVAVELAKFRLLAI